jgi:hypothetical protein
VFDDVPISELEPIEFVSLASLPPLTPAQEDDLRRAFGNLGTLARLAKIAGGK